MSGNAAGPRSSQTLRVHLSAASLTPIAQPQAGGTAGNGGNGGGIYNNGQLTIKNSTIRGNNAGAGCDGGIGRKRDRI